MELRRLCVFCGSRPGAQPEYVQAARDLGAELVRRGIGLIYGGASTGVMGALADAVLAGGGEAIGVMPQRLIDREIAHKGLRDLRIVGSMHERKALMERLSEGFIALPGGFGTFDELFEIITWSQLGLHQKPVGILDVAGYFGPMRELVQMGAREGFIPREHAERLVFESTATRILDRLGAVNPS
jgi:uncharacterized protein (TIGR00730 family)